MLAILVVSIFTVAIGSVSLRLTNPEAEVLTRIIPVAGGELGN